MLIYVSGPYSSCGEVEANIQAARQVAIRLCHLQRVLDGIERDEMPVA